MNIEKNLKGLDDEIEMYVCLHDGKFAEWMDKKEKGMDEFLYLMKKYYFFLTYTVDKQYLSNTHKSTKMLYSKAATDLLAIYNCLNSGCLHQAYTILRTLLETTAHTIFIYQKPEIRLNLYYNYRFIVMYHNFTNDKHSGFQEVKEEYTKYQQNYSKNKEWYDKELRAEIYSNPKFIGLRDDKMSFKKLCIVANMKREYQSVYSGLSHSTHSTSLLDHLFLSNSESYSTTPIFKNNESMTAICLTIGFIDDIYKEIVAHCNHSESTLLIHYSNRLLHDSYSLIKKYRTSFPF
ncbi:DUF5677 domain-containing protein [Paenibacillus sp. FSL H7-0350]|uniref:DUF5677 domain-containing protein n=1 Tax=Paenibacillus sp. FSL H7-0350 TaxID=2975345 RepID=UPI003159402B